jgi:hypothetical protein
MFQVVASAAAASASCAASWCRYGFLPHRIALWIYWHAALLLLKGVPLYSPPPPSTLAAAAAKTAASHPCNAITMCPFTWRPARGFPWNTWGNTPPGDLAASSTNTAS